MGDEAGGHLVSLLALDEQYLIAVGLNRHVIKVSTNHKLHSDMTLNVE